MNAQIERKTQPIELSDQAQSAGNRLFFGGSFDPPHLGHIQLPLCVSAELESSQVIYVPASRSPLKSNPPVSNHHRVNMLRIGLNRSTGWEIWEQELQDAGLNPDQPSYWADTWAIVRGMNLAGTDRFLIGADQVCSMHRWRRFAEFWKDALVVLRDKTDSAKGLISQLQSEGNWSEQDIEHWERQIITAPTIDASSTTIRAALQSPSSRNHPITGLDPDVQRYIVEHELYK